MEKPHVLRLALSDALLDDPSAASPVHTRTTDSESLVYHRVRRQVVQHGLARVHHHGNASTKESHHRARITRLERQLAIVEKYRQEKARQDARPQVAGDTTDVRNASSSASTVVAEHPVSQFPRKIGLRQLTPSPSDPQAKNQQEEDPEHSENNSTSCPTALGMERFAVLALQSTSLKSDSASQHTVALVSSVNQSSTPGKYGKAPSRAHFDKSTAHVLCELKITKDIMMREYYVQQIHDEAASLSQLATDLHDMVQRKAKQESLNSVSSGLASRRHSYAMPAMTPGSSFTKQPQESGEGTSTVLSDPTRCDAEIPEWEARNSDLVYKSHHRITQLHRLVESLQTTTIGLVESILEWRAYKSKPSTMSNIEKHHRFGWKKQNIANYLAHIDSDLRDLFPSPITSILLGANAKYNPLLLPRAALDALGIPEDTFESTTFLTDRQDRSHSVSSEGATTCQLPSPTKRQAYAALHNAVRTVTATLNASPSQFDAGQLRNCLYAIHKENELERNAIDSQITEKLRVATAYNPFESIKLAGGVEDAIAKALSQQPEAESVKRAKQLRRRQEDTSRAKQHPCDKGNQGEEVSNHATPLFVNPGRMRRLIEQRKDVREAATDCELRDTTASWQKNKLQGQVMVRRMNIRQIENQHARTIQQQFLVYRRRTQLLRNLAHFVATSRQRVVSIQRLVRGFIAKTRYKEALLRHEERHQRRLAARTIWYAYKRYKRRQRHQRHPHIMSVETIAEIQLIHVLQHQLGDSVVNETSSAERYRKAGEERRRQRAVYLSKRRQELLELETKRTAAAVCIQSIYRMQLARKLAVTIRGERRAHLSAVSAIMIQSKIRRFLKHQEKRRQRFRNDMERVNRSAVRIQSIYRGYNSRTGLIDELSTLAQDGCSKLLEEEEDEEEDNDSEGRSCSENDETLDPGYTILPPIGKSRPSTDSSSHGLTSRSDLHFEEGQDDNWSATSIRVSVSSIPNVSLPPIRPRMQSVIQPRSNSVQRTMRQPSSARRPPPSEMMKVELKLKETTLGDDLDLSAANGHKRGSYMGPRRRLSTTPTGSPRWGSSDADGANDCRGSVQGKVLSQLEITNRGWNQVGKNEGA